MDRHSRNSGDGSWRNNGFGLIASHNYKISWDWYKRFTLTNDQPTKTSLDWRESRSPQGQRSSWTESYWPADRSASGERKGRLLKRCPYMQPVSRWLGNNGKESRLLKEPNSRWLGNHGKEVCGFPDGHLIKQTRERCSHILALANTRTALRSWWENSGDVTRILLTAVADPLARQGAKMSDTITLCTRILLTTQDPHSEGLDHGGSSRAKGTRGGKQKRNITELLGCSCQSRIYIYSRSRRMDPSVREAIVLSWSFEVWAHKQARTLVKVADSRS